MIAKINFFRISILPIALLFLLSGAAIAQTGKQTILLKGSDNVEIEGIYYPIPTPKAPVVVLLPDTRCDKSIFGKFAAKLNEAGFAALAIDFRYKKNVSAARSKDEAIAAIQRQDLNALVTYDTKSAIEYLSNKEGIDPERIGMIGTSLGARVALVSGVKYKVKALVLVSLSGQEAIPGGVQTKTLLEEYGMKPVLFMTSEKDWGGDYKAAEHNKLYFDWAKGAKELKIWPGSGHGIEILDRKETAEFVLSWLKNNL